MQHPIVPIPSYTRDVLFSYVEYSFQLENMKKRRNIKAQLLTQSQDDFPGGLILIENSLEQVARMPKGF